MAHTQRIWVFKYSFSKQNLQKSIIPRHICLSTFGTLPFFAVNERAFYTIKRVIIFTLKCIKHAKFLPTYVYNYNSVNLISYYCTNNHDFRLLSNWPTFPHLLQVRVGPKSKLQGILGADLLTGASCYQTNSINAPKNYHTNKWVTTTELEQSTENSIDTTVELPQQADNILLINYNDK